jgi:hypothetical protein
LTSCRSQTASAGTREAVVVADNVQAKIPLAAFTIAQLKVARGVEELAFALTCAE